MNETDIQAAELALAELELKQSETKRTTDELVERGREINLKTRQSIAASRGLDLQVLELRGKIRVAKKALAEAKAKKEAEEAEKKKLEAEAQE